MTNHGALGHGVPALLVCLQMTNSRGFTVELCAAAVVILGSRFNLPLS